MLLLPQTKPNFECCESNGSTESLSENEETTGKQNSCSNNLNVAPQLMLDESNDNTSDYYKKLESNTLQNCVSGDTSCYELAENTLQSYKNSVNEVQPQISVAESVTEINQKSMSRENLTCLSDFSGVTEDYKMYMDFKKKIVYDSTQKSTSDHESKLEKDIKSCRSWELESIGNRSSSQVILFL